LEDVVQQIDEDDFKTPSEALSKATLGQHLRHTLEFFLCLEQGFEAGLINYDKRAHNHLIENDKSLASDALRRIQKFVADHREDKMVRLEVTYERDCENWVIVESNYRRELVYNIEHAIHHMAIMKIGIREIAPYIQLPADFGIAVSTLRFKEASTLPVA
jgi:uncharacterized damage-inducible protein DinB